MNGCRRWSKPWAGILPPGAPFSDAKVEDYFRFYYSYVMDEGPVTIDEGYAYWWNGACRALEALDIVRHATGGVLDASDIPALRETVAFPHRMHLGSDWYLNVADGQARGVRERDPVARVRTPPPRDRSGANTSPAGKRTIPR